MDLKTEYIIKQLGRTKNKKYEMYVVNRIINLINDFDIKFITQQYVSRSDGKFALTDLYFPQFHIHIEVDEPAHKNNKHADEIREQDIVSVTGCPDPIRIDVDKTIYEINNQIDNVVKNICELKQEYKDNNSFIPWNIEVEFNPDTYINLGYIDIKDNVAFRTIKDGCNCFGHNYKGYQKAEAKHARYPDIGLWFPKLYSNKDWDNYENPEQTTITEKPKTEKYKKFTENYLKNIDNEINKQIVFARVKDNLGNILYRFRGMYELEQEQSIKSCSLVWNRIKTRVETFKYNPSDA